MPIYPTSFLIIAFIGLFDRSYEDLLLTLALNSHTQSDFWRSWGYAKP